MTNVFGLVFGIFALLWNVVKKKAKSSHRSWSTSTTLSYMERMNPPKKMPRFTIGMTAMLRLCIRRCLRVGVSSSWTRTEAKVPAALCVVVEYTTVEDETEPV